MKNNYLIAILIFCTLSAFSQQETWFGCWQTNTGIQYTHVVTSLSAWSALDNDYVNNQGLRLVDFEKYEVGTQDYYFGCWRSGTGIQYANVVTTLDDWSALDNDYVNNQGLRLVDFEKYEAGGQDLYFGCWQSGTGIQYANVVTTLSAWSALDNDYVNNQGLRLVDFEKYEVGGQDLYFGCWQSGTGTQYWNTVSSLDAWSVLDNDYVNNQGLRLVDFEKYEAGGQDLYLGCWQNGTGVQYSNAVSSLSAWSVLDNDYVNNQGLRLIDFENYESTIDPAVPTPNWECTIRSELDGHVGGYAYVIMKDGLVIDSMSYGYARTSYEPISPCVKMTTNTKMHIASVSKAITAVAFLNLIENDLTQLDNTFWSYIANHAQITNNPASGITNITIRNLLQMKSGFGVNNGGGDIYDNYWSQLNNVLETPLNATPGTVYEYNNANLATMQTVIEVISGMSYANYVQNFIFAPMGITGMSPVAPANAPTLCYRSNNTGCDPGHLWNEITFSTASGGWVGSVADLALFLKGLRNNTVLGTTATQTLFDEHLRFEPWFGAYGEYLWHNGALINGVSEGLRTTIIRFTHGYDAALITNTSDYPPTNLLVNAFESSCNTCAAVSELPCYSEYICGTEIQLTGTGYSDNGYNPRWVTSLGGSIVSGGSTLSPVVNAGGLYCLIITDNANGCVAESCILLKQSTDLDNDNICDDIDNCLNYYNPGQVDTNQNGIGDECETACQSSYIIFGSFPAGSNLHFQATNAITATSLIESGAIILFDAGTEILMNAGFEVVAGATFEALMNGCQ